MSDFARDAAGTAAASTPSAPTCPAPTLPAMLTAYRDALFQLQWRSIFWVFIAASIVVGGFISWDVDRAQVYTGTGDSAGWGDLIVFFAWTLVLSAAAAWLVWRTLRRDDSISADILPAGRSIGRQTLVGVVSSVLLGAGAGIVALGFWLNEWIGGALVVPAVWAVLWISVRLTGWTGLVATTDRTVLQGLTTVWQTTRGRALDWAWALGGTGVALVTATYAVIIFGVAPAIAIWTLARYPFPEYSSGIEADHIGMGLLAIAGGLYVTFLVVTTAIGTIALRRLMQLASSRTLVAADQATDRPRGAARLGAALLVTMMFVLAVWIARIAFDEPDIGVAWFASLGFAVFLGAAGLATLMYGRGLTRTSSPLRKIAVLTAGAVWLGAAMSYVGAFSIWAPAASDRQDCNFAAYDQSELNYCESQYQRAVDGRLDWLGD